MFEEFKQKLYDIGRIDYNNYMNIWITDEIIKSDRSCYVNDNS